MLEEKQIMDKLYEQADLFMHHFRKKEYPQAKVHYDTARNVAVFLEMDEKVMQELFGERGERGVILKQGDVPGRVCAESISGMHQEGTDL